MLMKVNQPPRTPTDQPPPAPSSTLVHTMVAPMSNRVDNASNSIPTPTSNQIGGTPEGVSTQNPTSSPASSGTLVDMVAASTNNQADSASNDVSTTISNQIGGTPEGVSTRNPTSSQSGNPTRTARNPGHTDSPGGISRSINSLRRKHLHVSDRTVLMSSSTQVNV
jgi:hypothetical protein